MNESKTKEQLKVPLKSVKDNYTNTLYKRPFLIEKIKKDVYGIKKYNSINSSISDKQLILLKKSLKKKIEKTTPTNSNLSDSNNLEHLFKYIGDINNNLQIISIKNKRNVFQTRRILQRQKSDFDLPKINSRKISKNPLSKSKNKTVLLKSDISSQEIQENMTNNEILDPKELYNKIPKVLKIRSFVNSSRNSDLSVKDEKKIYNINEINDRYNLKLNLGNINKKKSSIFHGKRYTIVGMLNKLFHYYSSDSINNNNSSNIEQNQTSNYINNSKSNSSLFFNSHDKYKIIKSNYSLNKLMIDTRFKNEQNTSSEINNNSYENSGEDTNTFLTKLYVNNKEFLKDNSKKEWSVTKFINNRCSLSEIIRRNKDIVDINKKVAIDCLLSKAEKKISVKKILYKYLGKSIFQIQDQPSYERLKLFEQKLAEILKKEK